MRPRQPPITALRLVLDDARDARRERRGHGDGPLQPVGVDLHDVVMHLVLLPSDETSAEKSRNVAVWTLGEKPVLAIGIPQEDRCRSPTGRPALGALGRDVCIVAHRLAIGFGIQHDIPEPSSIGGPAVGAHPSGQRCVSISKIGGALGIAIDRGCGVNDNGRGRTVGRDPVKLNAIPLVDPRAPVGRSRNSLQVFDPGGAKQLARRPARQIDMAKDRDGLIALPVGDAHDIDRGFAVGIDRKRADVGNRQLVIQRPPTMSFSGGGQRPTDHCASGKKKCAYHAHHSCRTVSPRNRPAGE